MAAEIDSLEIKISAESQNAAANISALATSLEQLAQFSSGATSNLGTIARDLRSFNNRQFTESIARIVTGFSALSAVDTSGIDQIQNFVNSLNELQINGNVAESFSQIGRAVNRLSRVQFGEELSDNLRLFIDTVHAITDDDAQRIRDIADAARGLSNINIENEEQPEEQPVKEDIIGRIFPGIDNVGEGVISAFSKIRDGAYATIGGVISILDKASESASKFNKAIIGIITSGIKASIGWIMSPLKNVSSMFSNAAKKAGEFFSSIKRIAMYRLIRTAMKAISQGFQEGRENLYQYSLLINGQFAKSMDMAATSFLYLKNSIGAATSPLTNYLVPILDRVVDQIVEVINKFNEMTAVLTGADTWTKAIKYPTQWKEAADDATKAAKKLKSFMLGFDELNVIEPTSNSGNSSTESGLDYSKMFEEVKVDADLSEDTKSRIPSLFEPIMSAWDSEGMNTLNKIAAAWENIRGLVDSVGDAFIHVWENGTGQKTLETILKITGSIVGTFGNLAKGIKKAWDNNGNGIKIMQSIWDIGNNVLTVFGNIWSSIEEWAATVDFEPAIKSLGTLFDSIKKITDPDGALARLFGKFWDDVLLPIATWTIEDGVPAAVDALSAAIDALGYALELAEPYLGKFIEFVGDVAGFTGENITVLLKSLKNVLEIAQGKDLSDEDVSFWESFDSKNPSGWSKFWQSVGSGEIGYSLFDRINPDAAATGTWGDGGYNHIKGKQATWDAPTEIHGSFERWYESIPKLFGAYTIEFNTVDTKFGNDDNEDSLGLINAWLAGIGQQSIGGIHTLDEAIGDDGILGFLSDQTDSHVIDALYAGSLMTKSMSFDEAWLAGLGISEESANNMKDFFKDFMPNWSSGWESITNTASEKWNGFKSDWASGVETMKQKLEDFKSNWSSFWGFIKKTASEKWSSFQSDWGSGVDTIKQKWEGFKTDWSSGWESIRQTTSEKWGNIKSNWSSGWESIKRGASETWENVKGGLRTFGDEAGSKVFDFVETWKSGWREISKFVGEITSKIAKSILGIWEGSDGKHGLKGVINLMLGGAESFLNFIVRGINALIERINTIKLDSPVMSVISAIADKVLPDSVSLDLKPISSFNLPRLATGGVVDTGQMFIAREQGAELVGRYNNRTAVMNNEQIVDAVSDGVYRAVMSAMQRGEQSGSGEIKVYLDGRQITARTEEVKRNNGVSILGGVVYST